MQDEKTIEQQKKERRLLRIMCKKCKENKRANGSSRCQKCTDEYRELINKK